MPNEVNETLDEARLRFIALWGRMGSSWGIPRTMAEAHALLFIVGEPMNTDEVMEALGISRGSASTTLRSLEEWGLVQREHRRGDRKEYFHAEQDVWTMFRTILRERKKREVDPMLQALNDCRELTTTGRSRSVKEHNERLDELMDFIQLVDAISQKFVAPSGRGLRLAANLLSRAS